MDTVTHSGPDDSSSADDASGCGLPCSADALQPGDDCEPIEQGCAPGFKCVWYLPEGGERRREAGRCIPVTGDGQPFEPCSLPNGIGPEITDDCGADSYCLEVYGLSDHGFCAPFMDGPLDDCRRYPGARPALENGSDFPSACLIYECQPLVEGACPAGMQCIFYPAFLYGANMCWFVPPMPAPPLGAPCAPGECGPAQLCLRDEFLPACDSDRCCAQWCDLRAPTCDDPATICEHTGIYDRDPAFEWLGACVVPGAFG
ncbi:MAG: hypothetical protein IPH07_08255 [Deltaproteobacteria bacterium]|nr:hypothetical protein [Deltaproteobacteria bacterium]MBK8720025.1 hypothetical protein [Deltaproteobacteria bacterium]